MNRRAMGLIGLAALAAGSLLPGCGGGRGEPITIAGVYAGLMAGDGSGPLRFEVRADGDLEGNFRLPPICGGPVHIIGSVTEGGGVSFEGKACGILFRGVGRIESTGGGELRGSGTWTGSDGSSGTWGATWVGQTGSIGV